jgi:hypothetical protein
MLLNADEFAAASPSFEEAIQGARRSMLSKPSKGATKHQTQSADDLSLSETSTTLVKFWLLVLTMTGPDRIE